MTIKRKLISFSVAFFFLFLSSGVLLASSIETHSRLLILSQLVIAILCFFVFKRIDEIYKEIESEERS